jgi:hypothetical protein
MLGAESFLMRPSPIFLLLAAWIPLASCHSSQPQTLPEACAAYADAICAKYDACGASFAPGTGSGDLCVSRVTLWCSDNAAISGSSFRPDKLAPCADEVSGLDCFQVGGWRGSSGEACGALFRGTVAKGGACSVDIQCEGGACRMESPNTCGVCTGLAHEGDDCSTAAVVCDDGLYCSDQTQRCTKAAGAGAPCQEDAPSCTGDLWCSGGTCTPLLGEGASCGPDVDNLCALDLTCDSKSSRCVKYVETVSAADESCSLDDPTHVRVCGTGTFCANQDTPDAVCTPTVPDGKDCSTRAGDPCLFPSKCIDGVCGPPDPLTCH